MRETRNEFMFMAGVAVYLAILYFASDTLAPASKALPMAVMAFTALVIAVKVLAHAVPQLQSLDSSGGKSKRSGEGGGEPAESDVNRRGSHLRTAFVCLVAMAAFPLGIYLIGLLPTLFVWLMAFMVGPSRIKIARAAVLGVSTWAVLYGLFGVLLKVNFPGGVLF